MDILKIIYKILYKLKENIGGDGMGNPVRIEKERD